MFAAPAETGYEEGERRGGADGGEEGGYAGCGDGDAIAEQERTEMVDDAAQKGTLSVRDN